MPVSLKNTLLFSLLWATLLLSACGGQSSQSPNRKAVDWENPQIIGRNKLPARAAFTPFADESFAQQSSRVQSLNGNWKFHWSKNPEQRPLDFYQADFDDSQWADIQVPGNWQTQGFGIPIYANIEFPFAKDPPYVTSTPPEDFTSYELRNPVGSYRTTFNVDKQWLSRKTIIHFGGVKSAMYLWVNGQKVGYSQGSMTAAEFDISPYLQVGNNVLAAEVYRWSDGSYLEDQDMWRFSGIFRDVTLLSRPDTHIRDFKVSNEFSPDWKQAEVWINADVNQLSTDRTYSIKVSLFKPGSQDILATKSIELTSSKPQIKLPVANPELWSAESPNLYNLEIVLYQDTHLLEKVQQKIGLRHVELKDQQLWVNGKSIKLKGVNRHEHHPRTGRYLDTETMRRDIVLMKQANINMVRLSHYPNDERWYQLADEYGLYLMDEANQESHGFGHSSPVLGDDPDWKLAHVDRATSMVAANKNHPSVIIWSLGNEGGAGQNFKAMREAVLALDSSRPILSESDEQYSDLAESSYRRVRDLPSALTEADDKPLFMREYAHAMMNSLGNLQEFWDLIEQQPQHIGGAIWDWVDQGLAVQQGQSPAKMTYIDNPSLLALKDNEVWAYGGDFGDKPTWGDFIFNGLIGPDRTPNPSYFEVKKVYQYVRFEARNKAKGQIRLHNKYDFTDLSAFKLNWTILTEGQITQQGIQRIQSTLPGNYVDMNIPFNAEQLSANKENLLQISLSLKESQRWASAGFEVARQQFELTGYSFDKQSPADSKQYLTLTKSKQGKQLTGDKISVSFNLQGHLTQYEFNQHALISAPLTPYFWKPANSNQMHEKNAYLERMAYWRGAHNKLILQRHFEKQQQDGSWKLSYLYKLDGTDSLYRLDYQIYATGQLEVTANYWPSFAESLDFMPKFGFRTELAKKYQNISWYGRGPHENYPDRKQGAWLGLYQQRVSEFHTKYVRPQDNSNRTDNRWMRLADNNNKGLSVYGHQPFSFRAWPYTESDLEANSHYYELPERETITVNFDLNIHGVGGDNSWGKQTMKKYHVNATKAKVFGLTFWPDQL